jgi:4-amino-4-deoxy-L-arabinose transferase-like glycosyltransferase
MPRALTALRPELAALLILAAFLNLWALSINGWANDYYAAAVKSMSTSWHAFLYGSFDVAGLQTVDKPPLALWVQALSVRAFGYSSWSLLVPQALMGVATVGLVYDLAQRRFGRAAGFVAGIALALTPITVAISRHNNPDALLILCLVAAVWALDRGLAAGGKAKWLMWSAVFVGLGFETKMAAALLVVPGMAAAWFWVAPRGRKLATGQLLTAGGVMSIVGLAWPVLMWLTPASSRPYVSGTDDNSIWSLILGYNGLGRLFGQDGGPTTTGGGGAGGVFGGSTGALRLLNETLGGQGGWLLGFAVVAIAVLAVRSRLSRTSAATGFLIAVGGTFAITAFTFSRAEGIFHPYYVSALAPFTALLVGAGFAQMRESDAIGRLGAPLLLAGGALTEAVVIAHSATDLDWASGIIIVASAVAAAALALLTQPKVRMAVAAVGVAVLLAAPASWAVQTLGHATSSTFPAGGPSSANSMGMGGGGGRGGMGGGGMRGGTPPSGAAGQGGFGGPPSSAGTTTNSTGAAAATGATSTTGATATQSSTTGTSTGTTSGTTSSTTGSSATTGTSSSATATQSSTGGPGGGGSSGGGMFGGNTTELTAAISYAKANGGGTVVISSQSGATSAIIASGADVAAIGGFSGSETVVTTDWLADAVASGKVRWVLVTSTTSGGMSGGRTGATAAMAIAAKVGKSVSSVSGLYDLKGTAAAIRAAA